MSNERELFTHFAPQWWDVIHGRAWRLTCENLGFQVRPILFTGLLFVLVTLASLFLFEANEVLEGMWKSTLVGLGAVLVFGAVYGVNFLWAARDEYYVQQRKITDLETTLAKPRIVEAVGTASGSSSAVGAGEAVVRSPGEGELKLSSDRPVAEVAPVAWALEDRLIQFRIDGVKLRNEHVVESELDDWYSRVDSWQEAVLEIIRRNPRVNQAFVARFITLKDVPFVKFSWAANGRHLKELQMLNLRIDILLELMAST